jgi:hypothetical protein
VQLHAGIGGLLRGHFLTSRADSVVWACLRTRADGRSRRYVTSRKKGGSDEASSQARPRRDHRDLVDNSVDATASTVLIRFLYTEDDLVSLVVVDDGRGMREKNIDRAMQFGGRQRTLGPGQVRWVATLRNCLREWADVMEMLR